MASAPVVLALGVDQRVAVDFRGRGEQEPGAARLGEPERLVGAERAHLERLDGELEVIDGRGGTGEVQHVVERAVDDDEVGHVVLDEQEPGVAEMGDVVQRPGDEAVHADHLAAARQQEVAEVGADESGAARHQDPHEQSLATFPC